MTEFAHFSDIKLDREQKQLAISRIDVSQRKTFATSFKNHAFVPNNFIEADNHYQTIIGTGAFTNMLFGAPDRGFNTVEHRIDTPDDDFFDVEYSENFIKAEVIVVVLHGLESSIRGSLMSKFAAAYCSKGFGFCLVSFRGCNGEPNKSRNSYHLGFTKDINQLTKMFSESYPDKYFYLSGFSLGGNVVLKFLGELGEEAWNRRIIGAAVACVPFDPVGSIGMLDGGFNRAVYAESFLKTLKDKAEAQIKIYPDLFDINKVRACQTIGDFDDHYIAVIYGYKDKRDYYRQNGAKWWLNQIRVPVIAINAIDDPFIRESSLPTSEDIGDSAPIRLIYHKHGGHCGFYTSYDGSELNLPVKSHGWLAEELARGLVHIQECIIKTIEFNC